MEMIFIETCQTEFMHFAPTLLMQPDSCQLPDSPHTQSRRGNHQGGTTAGLLGPADQEQHPYCNNYGDRDYDDASCFFGP